MQARIMGIIVILLGISAIGAIVYFLFFNKVTPDVNTTKSPAAQTQTTQTKLPSASNDNQPETSGQTTQVAPAKTNEPRKVTADDLKRIALSFTERYGSFSNQSNFANMTDLKIFMTRSMQQWVDDYVMQKTGKGENGIYYGVTTKAVAASVLNFDDAGGKSQIAVSTIRSESTGTTDNSSSAFSQDATITFVKENGAWKVDRAIWNERK